MLATIVDTSALLKSVVAAVVAGLGVTIVFSFAIWGAARFGEATRAERPLVAGGAAALTVVSLAVTCAAIVLGIVVMTSK